MMRAVCVCAQTCANIWGNGADVRNRRFIRRAGARGRGCVVCLPRSLGDAVFAGVGAQLSMIDSILMCCEKGLEDFGSFFVGFRSVRRSIRIQRLIIYGRATG